MAEVPICPIHNVPMRPGQHGGFFCARKNADGTWCTQRVAAPKPTAPAAAQPPAPAQSQVVLNDKAAIAVAALEMAGRVYQGSGPVGAAEVVALAMAGYKAMMTGEMPAGGDSDIPF
jgi:hypothetical protein